MLGSLRDLSIIKVAVVCLLVALVSGECFNLAQEWFCFLCVIRSWGDGPVKKIYLRHIKYNKQGNDVFRAPAYALRVASEWVISPLVLTTYMLGGGLFPLSSVVFALSFKSNDYNVHSYWPRLGSCSLYSYELGRRRFLSVIILLSAASLLSLILILDCDGACCLICCCHTSAESCRTTTGIICVHTEVIIFLIAVPW